MSPNEFFYWLQGYFEISGTTEPLNSDQAECIHRHINLVTTALDIGPAPGPTPERIIEIRTLIALHGNDPALVTTEIRRRIHEQFVNVIDKEASPEVQSVLNTAHGVPLRPGPGPAYRC